MDFGLKTSSSLALIQWRQIPSLASHLPDEAVGLDVLCRHPPCPEQLDPSHLSVLAQMKQLILIYVYGTSYRAKTLWTWGCICLKSCDLSHILLFYVRKRLFDLEVDYVFIWDLQVPKINPGRGDMKQFQTICYCLFSDICSNKQMQSNSKFFKYHLLIDMEIFPDHTEVRSID